MKSSCYDWLALAGMAFSAEGVRFPTVPRMELGEPIEFANSLGDWSLTITPDLLLCELTIGGDETTARFTVDLIEPTSEQVLRTIDYLINLGKVYVPNPSHNYFQP
jgi:hypothetical protein